MKKAIFAAGAWALPLLAFAQTLQTILQTLKNILDFLIPFLITLALVFFLWGLALFILKAGEEKEKGRDIMIYGIIALFVMVSIWGLVRVLNNTFNVGAGGGAPIPGVGGGTGGSGFGGSIQVTLPPITF